MRMPMRGSFCAVLAALFGSALVLTHVEAQAPQQGLQAPQLTPKVGFVLKNRQGHATPARTIAAHTGGGNTDVAQPSDDKLVITMSGVVTAGPYPTKGTAAGLEFDLHQEFAIVSADPKITKVNLTAEAQVIGLLRGDKHGGSASLSNGSAAIHCGGVCVLSISIDGHAVAGDDNLAINHHKGPAGIGVPPGEYHFIQTFRINAQHARSICGKAAAAEFAPDPTLDPTWISVADPFRGANKKEFGFRVILRVEPE